MIRPDYREIYHYGMPRRSGRYKWGSGDRPYQSLGGKIGSGAKKVYEKAKPVVKTAGKVAKNVAKFSAKTAVNLAISAALGKMGGDLAYKIFDPGEPDEDADIFEELSYSYNKDRARQISETTRDAIAISTMISRSKIGNMRVNSKQNNIENDKHIKVEYDKNNNRTKVYEYRDKNELKDLKKADKYFDMIDEADRLSDEGKNEEADKLYSEASEYYRNRLDRR